MYTLVDHFHLCECDFMVSRRNNMQASVKYINVQFSV